jgi:hypothetical protein
LGCNVLEFVVDMGFDAPFGFGILPLACESLEFRPFDEKGGAFVEGAFEFAIVPGGCDDWACENAPVKDLKVCISPQTKVKYHFAEKTEV